MHACMHIYGHALPPPPPHLPPWTAVQDATLPVGWVWGPSFPFAGGVILA